MISFDRAQQKIALSLFVVALVATLLLALMDKATHEPIAEAERAALHKSLVQVLPEYKNDPLHDMFEFPLSTAQTLKVYPSRDKEGKVIAYAWEQIAPDGYSGSIRILMGVRVSGEIVAIRVTSHKETPGLGDGITKDEKWLNSFVDKTLKNTKWFVKKDGGDFDQFTGATVTPRAVVKAVQQGLTMYQTNQNALLKAFNEAQEKIMQADIKAAGDKQTEKKSGGKTQ